MKKYLDTSQLITYQSGNNKGHYDWKNNIGKELYFEYDDINGIIKILDYEIARPQGKITLQYKENIMTTSTSNFVQLKIPSLFNKEKQTRKYTYINSEHSWDETIYDIMSINYYMIGNKKEGLKYLNKALKINPNNIRIKENKKYFI